MDRVVALYAEHAFWFWAALAALVLAIEVATGTGWLLWASASAAAVAVATALMELSFAAEVGLFAVLTLVTSLLAHRFWPARRDVSPDINDNIGRLIGREARVVAAFGSGRGRVEIDGKEWAATAAVALAPGELVQVSAVEGSTLRVAPL